MNHVLKQLETDGRLSSDVTLQKRYAEMAWNQQDPIKIAHDLNQLLKTMMQPPSKPS